MIINRVVKLLKQWDWGLVIIEFVLVFVGVFIVLQFDNWNMYNCNQVVFMEMFECVLVEFDLNDDVIDSMCECVDFRCEQCEIVKWVFQICDVLLEVCVVINLMFVDFIGDFLFLLLNEILL